MGPRKWILGKKNKLFMPDAFYNMLRVEFSNHYVYFLKNLPTNLLEQRFTSEQEEPVISLPFKSILMKFSVIYILYN